MKLAVLFWVYKDLAVCENRLAHLRRLNPNLCIYGLYGGESATLEKFASALKPWLDDFYCFPDDQTPNWKWRHGDQLISTWWRDRGVHLDWDTLFIAQWDMLLLSPVERLCRSLQADQLLLPGLRCVSDVKDWWWWIRPNSSERKDFLDFVELASNSGAFPQDPFCCQFMVAALPRRFLARYADLPNPLIGFLEYKIPIYAQMWGFEFCRDHPFRPDWRFETPKGPWRRKLQTFHAEAYPIPLATILFNAALPFGRRVFHPVTRAYPFA